MSYAVKEIYYTLQGEGAQTGRAAVFLRFSGCNLWSGLERDRARAVCKFCDTDFVGVDGPGGGKFADADALASAVAAPWPRDLRARPYVVCTGGEPLLQLDEPLIAALHAKGFEVAIETNGTLLPPSGIDWIRCRVQSQTGPGIEARLSAGERCTGAIRRPDVRSLLPATHGRTRSRSEHKTRNRLLSRPPAMAVELADAQADRDSVTYLPLQQGGREILRRQRSLRFTIARR
jgi:7-carboxy-7-deazaguanine synthase (Cx14CxxC type)